VWDCAVEALESHDFCSSDRFFEIVWADFDRKIPPVEVMMPVGSFDHNLRWVFRNRLTEGSSQFLLEV
jgi:hypothetical protein